MSDRRHERFNTRSPERKLDVEGAPAEEELSQAQMSDQLETEPEEAVNKTSADDGSESGD